jgi:hypothetical protein
MSPSWNNFLRSLLYFIVVRIGHDQGVVRIVFRSVYRISVYRILWWQKKKKKDAKKEEVS